MLKIASYALSDAFAGGECPYVPPYKQSVLWLGIVHASLCMALQFCSVCFSMGYIFFS